MTRFIDYQDGRKRTRIRIEFAVGSSEMANMIVANTGSGYDFNGPPIHERDEPATRFTSRTQVMDLVRQFLTSYGSHMWFTDSWVESRSPLEVAEAAAWAASEVRRLFPELDDTKLREWEQGWRA